MKKFISLALALATVPAFCMGSVSALNNSKPKFENEFKSYIEETAGSVASCSNYTEKYYHYDKNGNIDWCLISASIENAPGICHAVFDDVILYGSGSVTPFNFGLAVYDVANDEFYDICNAWDMDFAQLHESFYNVMTDANISCDFANVAILGDVDKNGKLDINDVTTIQNTLADDKAEDYALDFEHSALQYGENVNNLCDYNKDGVCSVSDATSLQIKLAE